MCTEVNSEGADAHEFNRITYLRVGLLIWLKLLLNFQCANVQCQTIEVYLRMF